MHLDITKKRYIYIHISAIFAIYSSGHTLRTHSGKQDFHVLQGECIYIYIHARDHNEYCIFWTLRVPIKPGINNQFLAHHGFISLCGHNCPITRK